jgi:hypothetical protein
MQIRDVFVIMPFSEQRLLTANGERTYDRQHFDDVYAVLLDAVHAFDSTIVVNRMEQPYGNLVNAIIKRLASADVVIAVLAGKNPNVFYELGVRHSLRLNTIMLVEHRDEYPFDLTAYFSKEYSIAHDRERKQLATFITDRLSEIKVQPLPDSPVLDVLKQAEFEQLRVLNMLETRRAAMILSGILGETLKIDLIFARSFTSVNRIRTGKLDGPPPQMALSWSIMDGFTKNRPVPGLPEIAYEHSESVYLSWRHMQMLWNEYAAAKEPPFTEMLQLVMHTDRATTALMHSATVALDFVITNEVAFGIPWPDCYESVEAVSEPAELGQLKLRVGPIANDVLSRFRGFEQAYLGAPPNLLAEVTAPSVGESTSFEALVNQAKAAALSGKSTSPRKVSRRPRKKKS